MTGAVELSFLSAMNESTNVTLNTRNLNANGAQYAINFQCPKAGNISKVHWVVDSVVGTPGRLLIQFWNIDADGAGSTGTQLNNVNDFTGTHTTGLNSYTLTTPLAVTRGQWIQFNIRASTASGTWDGSNRITVRWNYNADSPIGNFRYGAPYGSSGSAKLDGCGWLAVEYDDGRIVGFPVDTKEIFTASTGIYYGNCFTIPPEWGSAKVVGLKICTNNTGLPGTNVTYRLHSVSGTTATQLTSDVEDGDYRRNSTDAPLTNHFFSTPQIVNGGSKVIASIETTSTTLGLYRWNFFDSTTRAAFNNLTDIEGCTISGTTITFENKIYFLTLLVTDITRPTGGGGGYGQKIGGNLINV